jgi:hypothetical protein
MIRPSALQLAERCGLAPRLAEQYPQGSEYTERGNEVDEAITLALRSGSTPTDRDAAACVRWAREHLAGYELHPQAQVVLRDPETGEVLTEGTTDLYGLAADKPLIVVDWKKKEQYQLGRLAPPDGNLQTDAYAVAAGMQHGVSVYRKAIVLFGDGEAEALWSRDYPETEWWPVIERIRRIQERKPEPTVGVHCTNCYVRTHCSAWLLPANEGPGALTPFTTPTGLTPETAPKALLVVQAMEDALKVAKERLKDFAREQGGIRAGGKVWGPSTQAGRRSVDTAALERDGLLEKYSREGQAFERFGWRKG